MSHHFTRAKEVMRSGNLRENKMSGSSHVLRFCQMARGFSALCSYLVLKKGIRKGISPLEPQRKDSSIKRKNTKIIKAEHVIMAEL